jgi:hypothetical protein
MCGDRSWQNMQFCYGNTAVKCKIRRWWLCGNFLTLLICIKMDLKVKAYKNEGGINLSQNREHLWPFLKTAMALYVQ